MDQAGQSNSVPRGRFLPESVSELALRLGADPACEVTFTLGTEGRIIRAFCAGRPARADPPVTSLPWRGVFADYRKQEGRWVPTTAQVSWEIEGRDQPYWRGEMRDWGAYR